MLNLKHLEIQKQFLGRQLYHVSKFYLMVHVPLLTGWEDMSRIPSKKDSTDREFVASSRRKGERSRSEDIDAI
jgi:hypothetical protein